LRQWQSLQNLISSDNIKIFTFCLISSMMVSCVSNDGMKACVPVIVEDVYLVSCQVITKA